VNRTGRRRTGGELPATNRQQPTHNDSKRQGQGRYPRIAAGHEVAMLVFTRQRPEACEAFSTSMSFEKSLLPPRCYNPGDRHERTETDRFRAFGYEELLGRDKASLDIFWLRDESLEDTDNLPAPEVIAAEIVEDLQAALDQFVAVASSLRDNDTSV
jgi:hypothetical protein